MGQGRKKTKRIFSEKSPSSSSPPNHLPGLRAVSAASLGKLYKVLLLLSHHVFNMRILFYAPDTTILIVFATFINNISRQSDIYVN